jgi:hypothetical protein
MDERTEQLRHELILFLNKPCLICQKPYPDKRKWQIHHIEYKKGEKDSSDFKERIPHIITRGKRKGKKTTKTIYHSYKYHKYLESILKKDPERFAPIHWSCHYKLSTLARWKDDNIDRLAKYAKLSKKPRKTKR